jgi:hypothetical protein
MVSRQTCEVRRRLPRGVHFCAAKRNCHASIIETRGVTNTCGHQEAPPSRWALLHAGMLIDRNV